MPKFIFHMGVTLRSYGNVEVEADSVDDALKLLTADFVGENIDIKETTRDSGQDLAVIDVEEEETGERIAGYEQMFLPSPYDPPSTTELLKALKEAQGWLVSIVNSNSLTNTDRECLERIDAAITNAEAA